MTTACLILKKTTTTKEMRAHHREVQSVPTVKSISRKLIQFCFTGLPSNTLCHRHLILLELEIKRTVRHFYLKGGCKAHRLRRLGGRGQNEDIAIIKIQSKMAHMHFLPMMKEYCDHWQGSERHFLFIWQDARIAFNQKVFSVQT